MKSFGSGRAQHSSLTSILSATGQSTRNARRGRLPSFITQKSRSVVTGYKFDSLLGLTHKGNYAPRLEIDNYNGNFKNYSPRIPSPELSKALFDSDNFIKWIQNWEVRSEGTGFGCQVKALGDFKQDGSIADPNDRTWRNMNSLRVGCIRPFKIMMPVEVGIAARKLCAETKDPRYPTVYHTLEYQAHALYVLGRNELESDALYQPFAWYMLMIAAGLGQLDAALLLHQLQKLDSANFVEVEQRDVIARAAEQRLDWRAMVAHTEHMVTQLTQRRKGEGLSLSELEPHLKMLHEASQITKPTESINRTEEEAPAGSISVSRLETFEPPYKLTLLLTEDACLGTDTAPEELHHYFQRAAETGAIDYHDPEAAWLYSKWLTARGEQFSPDWQRYTEIAAGAGNSDACFQLGKYFLNQDGWYPTLTSRMLQDIRQRESEAVKRRRNAADFRVTTEDGKHKEIMDRVDLNLLQKADGLFWMKSSAELQIDSPTKMVNRYCIVAGLLRQNGFLQEGLAILKEAQHNLRLSTQNPTQRATALRIAAEYLQDWDRRKVHRLLTNDQISQLLGPPIDLSSKN